LKTDPNDDVTPMRNLQKELEQAWYAFVEGKWGKKVRLQENEKTTRNLQTLP